MPDKSNSTEQIIQLFESVRDIPYFTFDFAPPELIFQTQKAGCRQKHLLLAKLIKDAGYEVKLLVVTFKWSDVTCLPDEFRMMAGAQNVGPHIALLVKIDNRWVTVDATWDLSIKHLGFPVNTNWDGVSDMKVAVPFKKFEEVQIDDFNKTNLNIEKIMIDAAKVGYTEFADKLNIWLAENRKSN